jgi:hypothetical protein
MKEKAVPSDSCIGYVRIVHSRMRRARPNSGRDRGTRPRRNRSAGSDRSARAAA